MPRKKKDEVTPAVENTVEAVSAETTAATAAKAPAEKPKKNAPASSFKGNVILWK